MFTAAVHSLLAWGKAIAIPWQAWRGPEGSRRLRLPDFKTVGTWKWQGCRPYAPAAFTPQEIFLLLISVRGWVNPRAVVRPEGLCQWEIPVRASEIETATFRLVTQCLNQLRHQQREEYLRVSFKIHKIQSVYRFQICNFNFINFQGCYYFM